MSFKNGDVDDYAVQAVVNHRVAAIIVSVL